VYEKSCFVYSHTARGALPWKDEEEKCSRGHSQASLAWAVAEQMGTGPESSLLHMKPPQKDEAEPLSQGPCQGSSGVSSVRSLWASTKQGAGAHAGHAGPSSPHHIPAERAGKQASRRIQIQGACSGPFNSTSFLPASKHRAP